MARAVNDPASPDDHSSLEAVRDVEDLVDGLEARADELRLDAGNANQVLSFALVVFLSSESGREFGESLRFCTYERLRIANEHSEALQEELRAAEERTQAAGRVFSFVEELTSRLHH
jgi:hypothetical protein